MLIEVFVDRGGRDRDIGMRAHQCGDTLGSGQQADILDADGAALYKTKCAACHGARGEGKPADALVGGQGTLKNDRPVKTIGSFWPYATTLYDFINRAMPYNAPQSLSPDEVYAVTAWLLMRNGILPSDAVLDARSLPKVQMPNQAGFIQDPRPDTSNTACVLCK